MLLEFTYRNRHGSQAGYRVEDNFIRTNAGSVWAFASENDAQVCLKKMYAEVLEDRMTTVVSVWSN